MSLQVWLPLNGDLKNQGLNNVTVTNNGAVTDDNGKIGKCYLFDGNTAHTIGTTTIALTNAPGVSLTGWIKLNDLTTNQMFFGLSTSSGDNSMFRLYYNKERTPNELVIYAKAFKYFPLSDFTMDTNWHHYAITYNGSSVFLYIDGNFIGSQSASIELDDVRKLFISGSLNNSSSSASAWNKAFGLNGCANDVRVYDHYLSAVEATEIAKGLVLHYKLDDRFCEATTNLLSAAGSYQNATTLTVTHASSTGQYVNTGVICSTAGNNKVTYSAYIINNSDTSIYPRLRGMGADGSTYGSSVSGNSIAAGKSGWVKVTLDMTDTASYNGTSVYLRWQLGKARNTITGNPTIQFAQLEAKDHQTPWVLGGTTRTPTTIYDSSGYSNNGTIVGSLTAAAGSPRYDVATVFDGSSIIYKDNFIMSNSAMTLSYWVNFTDFSISEYPYAVSLANGGSGATQQIGVWVRGGNNTHTIAICAGGIEPSTGYAINTNTWYHIVETVSGSTIKLYVNGNLEYTATNANSPKTGTRLFVGARSNATSGTGYANQIKGNVSDVRIYATALSADDVADLYRTSMSIDSSGNIHARELKEV